MSTAEQIAVPDFIRDNKCRYRNGQEAEVFFPKTYPGLCSRSRDGVFRNHDYSGRARNDISGAVCSYSGDGYDLVPVEERPREWVLNKTGPNSYHWGSGEIGPQHNIVVGESLRLVELPDGWEVRRKPEEPKGRQLPDGVDALPDGFDYWGIGPLPSPHPYDSNDHVIAIMYGGEWMMNNRGLGGLPWRGDGTDNHIAIKRGTELHRLNFETDAAGRPLP